MASPATNTGYYPPVGFYFGVKIGISNDSIDAEFQSVSGLSVDLETEEYAEGGQNYFKHKLPVRTKFPNLVLKKGLVVGGSALMNWVLNAVQNFEFKTTNVTVSLYTNSGTKDKQKAIMVWEIVGCFPVKWVVDEFNATESKLVIETLELSYNYFTVKSSSQLPA